MPNKKQKIADDYRKHVFYDSDSTEYPNEGDNPMEVLGDEPFLTKVFRPQAIDAHDFSLQSCHPQTSITLTPPPLRAVTAYQGRSFKSATKNIFVIEYENSQGEIKKAFNKDVLDFIVDYYTNEPSNPQCVFKKIRNISGNFFHVLINPRDGKLTDLFFKYQHTLHPNFFGSKDANSVPKAAFYLAMMACIENANNPNFSLTDALNNSNFGYIDSFRKHRLKTTKEDGDNFLQINCLTYFSLLQKLARIEGDRAKPSLIGIPRSINIINLDIIPDALKTELLVGTYLSINADDPAFKLLNQYFSNTKTKPVLLKNLISEILNNQKVNFTDITNFVQKKRDLPAIPPIAPAVSADSSSAQALHDQASVAKPASAFQPFYKDSGRALPIQFGNNL